jgi:hypothetical protein
MKKIQLHLQILFTALSIVNNVAFAQEQKAEDDATTEEISIAGSVDTYFHKSFGTVEKAPRTSFANLPGFSLGMINVIAMYKGKKSGLVADLVFGPRGSDAVFNAPLYKNTSGGASSQIINQMYVYYQISKGVRLNFGQFNTFLSYEVISPAKNFHYSTSYLFSYGPFNHTGIWADLNLKKGWSAKLAIMNPTDYTEFNPFNSYTFGGQIGITKTESSFYLNATYGDPDGKLHASDSIGCVSKGNAWQADLVGSLNVTSKYTIGMGASYRAIGPGEVKTITSIEKPDLKNYGFCGVIIYQKISFSEVFSLGLRTEYFAEFNNGVGAIGTYSVNNKASVMAYTLSANIKASNLKIIPEVRLDKTSDNAYTRSTSGLRTSKMISVNFALVYTLPEVSHKISTASKKI